MPLQIPRIIKALYKVVVKVEKEARKGYNRERVAEDKEYLSFGKCFFGKFVVWVSFKTPDCNRGNRD
jgi:hypothetical protein